MMIISLLVLFGYFLGSLSAAIITCRIMGLGDPRSFGSHNPGATNVYEIAGKKAAALTLLGDLVKGLIPVLLGLYLELNDWSLALIGFSAFLGHLYPVFFNFQGGKGVATAFGVFIGLNIFVAIAVLFTWGIIVKIFKLSSLGAIITAIFAPVYFYLIDGSFWFVVFSSVISIILIYKHKTNILNIIKGSET